MSFKVEKIIKSKIQFKDWYTTELIAVCSKNNKVKCCCCNISQSHKMSCRYLYCGGDECNKSGACNVRYKVLNCDKKAEIYHVYRENEHDESDKVQKKINHGISNLMKSLVNELIFDKDVSVPKKIAIKLNSQKYIEKRTEDNKIYDVPTLSQIQNYVKYLKGKICTKNKVEDIKKFVNDNGYYADINPKEF
jgi:hypothetical protein